MNWIEVKNAVVAELDRRKLKSNVRYSALDKVEQYVQHLRQQSSVEKIFGETNKEDFKNGYGSFKGKDLNGAENSVINEIYNQYNLLS